MLRTTARFDDNLMAALQAKAAADKVSIAEVVRKATAQYLGITMSGSTDQVFNVAFGSTQLDIAVPVSVVTEMKSLILNGLFIEAIRRVRQATRCGLWEGKEIAEQVRATM